MGQPHLVLRDVPAVDPSPEGVTGSADPGLDRLPALTMPEAEGLLDWLEAHGCRGCEVVLVEGGFAVRRP